MLIYLTLALKGLKDTDENKVQQDDNSDFPRGKMKGNEGKKKQSLNLTWNNPVRKTQKTGDQQETIGGQIKSLDHIEQPSDEDTEDQKETAEDKIGFTRCCCCKIFNRPKNVFKRSKAKKTSHLIELTMYVFYAENYLFRATQQHKNKL